MKKATILKALMFASVMASALPAIAQKNDGGKQQAAKVIVTSVKKENLSDRVEALGTLRANETVEVTATVTEVVTAVNFVDGQRVEKGDVLVEMASGEEKAQLDQAQAVAAEARKQLERVQGLAKQGASSQSLLDERQRDDNSATGRLREVQSRMKNYLISAPFSGVVGLRNISVGALLQPGTKITTLDDDGVMKLDFAVPSVFIEALKIGAPISATAREFEGREFKGEVASIDSQIDPVTRSIIVRAIIPNDEHILKPGLLMSVELFNNQREAIVVPEESIVPEGFDNYVFVINQTKPEATAEKRKVTVGTRQPGKIEIVEGLQIGEKIVTHGTMNVRPGQPVSVTAEEKGGEPLADILKNAPKTEPAPEGKK